MNPPPIRDAKPIGNDNDAPPRWPGLGADFVMALRLFSRLPTGRRPHEKPDLSRIVLALPFASLMIGIGPSLLLVLGVLGGLPSYFAAALAIAALVIVNGAMAEDGLADAADGLFGGGTREKRLEILKDSRHGTYGVAALCLFLVLRLSALGTASPGSALGIGAFWLAATMVARSGALWLTVALPPARTDGVSAATGRLSLPRFGFGMGLALLLGSILAGPSVGVLGLVLALLLALVTVAMWTALCRRLVGGQTGDLIGALQALIEVAVLTGFLLGR